MAHDEGNIDKTTPSTPPAAKELKKSFIPSRFAPTAKKEEERSENVPSEETKPDRAIIEETAKAETPKPPPVVLKSRIPTSFLKPKEETPPLSEKERKETNEEVEGRSFAKDTHIAQRLENEITEEETPAENPDTDSIEELIKGTFPVNEKSEEIISGEKETKEPTEEIDPVSEETFSPSVENTESDELVEQEAGTELSEETNEPIEKHDLETDPEIINENPQEKDMVRVLAELELEDNFEDFEKDLVPKFYFSTEEEKEKRKKYTKEVMDKLRDDLRQLREWSKNEDAGYEHVRLDEEYLTLLEEGDFRKNDYDFQYQRIYPSIETIQEYVERRRKEEEGKQKDYSWKMLKKDIRIKEFDVSEEAMKAQIMAMKGETHGHELAPVVQEISKAIEELPGKQDLEKYIGENLISKIAAIVIAVGLIILYRFGIAEGYVPEWVRITLGGLTGAGLLGGAFWLKKKKGKMPALMVSASDIAFYYTIYLTFDAYELVNQWIAFGLMLVVTGSSIIFAYFQDKRVLAVSALFAGYVAPALLFREQDHFAYFFLYVYALNVIMMVLAYIRKWRIINVMGTLSTCLLLSYEFAGDEWLAPERIYWIMLLFTVFYLLFFAANGLYSVRAGRRFLKTDFVMMILVTGVYVFYMKHFLEESGMRPIMGLFFVGMGLFNLGAVSLLFDRKEVDQLLSDLLFAKVVIALITSGFFLVDEVYINVFLVGSAVGILWFGESIKIDLLKDSSMPILMGGTVSMLLIWQETYFMGIVRPVLLNEAFLAGLVTFSGVGACLYWVLGDEENQIFFFVKRPAFIALMRVTLVLGIYLMGIFEIWKNTPDVIGGSDFRVLLGTAWHFFYVLGLRILIIYLKRADFKLPINLLTLATIVGYLAIGHPQLLELRWNVIYTGWWFPIAFHYAHVLLTFTLLGVWIWEVIRQDGMISGPFSSLLWLTAFLALFHLSVEIENTWLMIDWFTHVLISMEESLRLARFTGFTIGWSVYAFLCMVVGIVIKIRTIRVISLTLFSITLLKFIFYDFTHLSILERIVSILVIGLLMLGVSRMYSHLHKLVEEGKIVGDKDRLLPQKEIERLGKLTDSIKKLGFKKKGEEEG